MNSMGWNWALIVVGAVMVLVEVALGGFAGFDLVLIGSAFVLGGALGFGLGGGVPGMIAAGVLCIAYVAVGRRKVRERLRRHPGLVSNADAVIGQRALVTMRVAEHSPGQVRVRDEVWRAVPAPGAGPFEPGMVVQVAAVDGVTLQVR